MVGVSVRTENKIRPRVILVLELLIWKFNQIFPVLDDSGDDVIVISQNASSHFQLICDTSHMTALLKRAHLPKHVNVDRLYLQHRGCKAEWNSTHVIIKTSLSGCGTTFSKDHQTIFFSNVLSEEGDSLGVGNSTKTYLLRANLTCSYPRRRTVGSLNFTPVKRKLFVSLGTFMSH